MLKVKAEIALEFIRDILQLEDKPYIFRHKLLVKNNNVKPVNYGTHMTSFVAPRIRDVIPEDCQDANLLKVFSFS